MIPKNQKEKLWRISQKNLKRPSWAARKQIAQIKEAFLDIKGEPLQMREHSYSQKREKGKRIRFRYRVPPAPIGELTFAGWSTVKRYTEEIWSDLLR